MEVRTARLLLRECTPDDGAALRAFDTDPAIWAYRGGQLPSEEQSARRFARKLSAASEVPRTRYPLLVFLVQPQQLIGTATLRISHLHNQEGEVAGALLPSYWGQGLATEAGWALLTFGFHQLKLHRLWADCNPENIGSWRVMEKLGMRREGHLRACERVGEEWRDKYLYALLADEWRSAAV
jgi:[ribosomal protein S5]-alanine N-acetyltransferase